MGAPAGDHLAMPSQARAVDPLGLAPEEMRSLGHWLVDHVVDHLERLPDGPAIRTGAAGPLRDALGGPPPEDPGDPRDAMQTLIDVALAHMQHGDHPRYMARVPGPSSFAGVLGEWLGTGFNAMAASWAGGSGPATVELVVVDWLRALMGLPEGGEGILTSGGSLANLTGLAAARAVRGPGVAYLSDQTHASIARGLGALGFSREQVRIVPSDATLRLSAAAVAAAVREDRRGGLTPRFVVATAGTTNTGAVDRLGELAALCADEGLWLHVDGAYGAPAALCDEGRAALAGIELSDSLVLDPHKWLFQPYDVGCLLVRDPGVLERAFSMTPEYLVDVHARRGEVDFRSRGLELSRRSRALKLWLTFRTYGVDRIRAAIARGIALAEAAERLIGDDARWEVVTPAQLGVVTFVRRGAGPADPALRAAALAAEGFAAVSSTTLHGRPVLRLCTINPRTTEADLAATLDRLGTASVRS